MVCEPARFEVVELPVAIVAASFFKNGCPCGDDDISLHASKPRRLVELRVRACPDVPAQPVHGSPAKKVTKVERRPLRRLSTEMLALLAVIAEPTLLDSLHK